MCATLCPFCAILQLVNSVLQNKPLSFSIMIEANTRTIKLNGFLVRQLNFIDSKMIWFFSCFNFKQILFEWNEKHNSPTMTSLLTQRPHRSRLTAGRFSFKNLILKNKNV